MKKKILIYGSLAEGGIGKVLVDFTSNLNKDKYDVTVMSRFPGGYYADKFGDDVKVKFNMPFKETFSEIYNHYIRVICDRLPRKLIYKLFIHEKYDVEIACDDSFSARIIGGSTNKNSLKILWEHMDATKDVSSATYMSKEQVKEYFEPFDKIVGVSRDCMNRFVEKYGFAERASYIYNPIDIADIENKAVEFKPEELKENEFNILAIGRFMPQKAFTRLIEVCSKLNKDRLKFKLNIMGEGPEKEKIKKAIRDYNLSSCVNLLGFKDNPYPFIKESDLLVCSSAHESYCLVVAESLVIGTPVLSTKCAGPIELLDGGNYGKLVENSKEGLYEGIKELITDKDKLKYYKKQAERRKNFFTTRNCMEQWENIFDNS